MLARQFIREAHATLEHHVLCRYLLDGIARVVSQAVRCTAAADDDLLASPDPHALGLARQARRSHLLQPGRAFWSKRIHEPPVDSLSLGVGNAEKIIGLPAHGEESHGLADALLEQRMLAAAALC